MEHPDARFTWSEDYSLAYQVIGEGRDLVYLPPFLSNVVFNWHMPEQARFMQRLASFSRLIVMDSRGVGASDRPSPGDSTTLEDKVDDVIAVLSATMSWKATLFGAGRSAFAAMLAAAAHPDRFEGLILYGATPSWVRSEDLPWEDQPEELDRIIEQTRMSSSSMEWARSWVRNFAPSLPASSVRALADYATATAAAGGHIAEQRMLNQVDLRALLPTIRVPTLVLHRTDDPLEPVESGRFLAARIPDAKLVELPGRDGLPWIGDTEPILEQIELFVTGERHAPEPDRVLSTVLFTDIVDSTAVGAAMGDRAWREVRERHDAGVRAAIHEGRGREIKTMGDGFLVTFDGPARAISCAIAIAERTRQLGIDVRAGVHTGEIELDGDDIAGLGVTIGARIGALAGPSEVLVSTTVKDLVAGSGLTFEDAGEHELKGVPERWRLYRVVTD